MGASDLVREYETTSIKELKELVEEDIENDMSQFGSSYSGTWGSKDGRIVFLNQIAKNYDEAEGLVLDNSEKWDPLAVVKVKEYKGTEKQNEKIEELGNKYNEINKDIKLFQKNWNIKLKERKSKTIGCKSCGTRHLIENINGTYCPICKELLFSETDKKKLKQLNINKENIFEKRDFLKNKRTGNIKEYYVVGGWCSS